MALETDVLRLTQDISANQSYIGNFNDWYNNWTQQRHQKDKNRVEVAARNAGFNLRHPEIKDSYQKQIQELQEQLKTALEGSSLAGDIDVQNLVKRASSGDVMAGRALQERFSFEQQRQKEETQLSEFRTGLEKEQFGTITPTGGTERAMTLEEALSQAVPGGVGGGNIGVLGRVLGETAQKTFARETKPLIESQLGARGLLDSGANVELQSKAMEESKQALRNQLLQAGLGARGQISGLQRADILEDIGARRQALGESFGLQRQGVTMSFQMQLQQMQNQLARDLAKMSQPSGFEQFMQYGMAGLNTAGMLGWSPFGDGGQTQSGW